MKKQLTIFLAAMLAALSLSACRRDMTPMSTMDTTVPLATVKPTTEPTTVPTTEATVPTRSTVPMTTEAVPESTIEDGNGPLPSDTVPSTR